MSQFAQLRNKDIVGFVEDSSKSILTIFLANGGCCVLLWETVKRTLEAYSEENIEDLFSEYVWDDNSGVITFGDGPLDENQVERPEDSIKPKKKSKF